MKKIRNMVVAFLLLFATGCSLIGGGSEAKDAKAKEGWEMIQTRKGEGYYDSCEYYHIYNLGAINPIYTNNNVYDGKIFYEAYYEDGWAADYYRYTIANKNLESISYEDFVGARQLARSEGVAYHGTLGEVQENN